MTDAEEMVAFRLPARDRTAIERLVADGHFHNRSDFLRYAVKATLRDYPASTTPDLTMEGVSLPDHAPARKSAAPRARKGVNL